MTASRKCGECGAALAADAPRGLCPKCLLRGAMAGNDEETEVGLPDPSSLGSDAPKATPGAVRYFGEYELLEEIARGGMGVVYKARQASLNRVIAIKMILAGQLARPEDVRRFRTEAEAAANLQHPNIVAIHEVGEHEGQHYFSMDYIEGKNLADLAQESPLPARRSAELLKTIAEAIHYAHQRGTLHRDIKPQNVLIDAAGQPRITDFGLAKQIERDSGLTRTGVVMGSPAYMPPEQAAGKHSQVGPPSDVYSLGATLYKLLTGQTPFQGETALATLRKVMEEEPQRPSKLNPKVPADLETICLKCLEKRPERRYSSARELGEELGRFLNHEPILAKPANPLRKAWLWLARHPWAITGLFSFGMLALVGLAYGLWEEAAMLRWKVEHPQSKALHGSWEDFFNPAQITALCLLFVFQSLPLIRFKERRRSGKLKRHDVWIFWPMALGLIWTGGLVAHTAVKMEVWVGRFGPSVLLWGLSCLGNIWFGILLIWKIIQHGREPAALDGGSAARYSGPYLARKGRLALIVLAEVAVVALAVSISLHHQGTSQANELKTAGQTGREIVAWSCALLVSGLSWTSLIVMLAYLLRSAGADRTLYLPLMLPALLIAIGGTTTFLVMKEARQIPVAVAFAAGVAGGWAILRWRCVEGGQTPWLLSRIGGAVRGPRARRYARVAAMAAAALPLLAVLEHFRGARKLARVREDMARRGQIAEFKNLLPAPPNGLADFTNRFARLGLTNSNLHGRPGQVAVLPGKAARGSQAPRPAEWSGNSVRFTNGMARIAAHSAKPDATWEFLATQVDAERPALLELRQLMREPPPILSGDYLESVRSLRIPNSGNRVRSAAHALKASAVVNLHRADLAAAEQDLVAMAGLVRMNSKDPTMVGQMMRVFVADLGVDALWDAAQADGWTVARLERIQHSWEMEPLVSGAARGAQAERLAKVERYEGLRRMTYREWQARCVEIRTRFGGMVVLPSVLVEAWREYIFHPAWKFAWAEQEEALWLEHSDDAAVDLQDRLRKKSFANINWGKAKTGRLADSRFYFELPLAESPGEIVSPGEHREPRLERLPWAREFVEFWLRHDFQPPDFSTGLVRAAQAENMRLMAVTALAIKRRQLRVGGLPERLAELVPEFLAETPVDWFDGKPLRYRPNAGGGYTLYSVGQDGVDNGGDPEPRDPNGSFRGPESGRDLVWPQVVPWEKTPAP